MTPCSKMRSRYLRLAGNVVKVYSHLYHGLFAQKRFDIVSEPARRAPAKAPRHDEIPFVIWQTNFTHRVTLPMWANHLNNRHFAPDFEYHYVSTEERDAYLRLNAPIEVYRAYSRLTDGAAQADLWRVFTLYREGGVYMDIDATLIRPLGPLLANEHQVFIENYGQFTNFFLATAPRNPLYKEVLDQIVYNIEHYDDERQPKGVFNTTGPGAFMHMLKAHPEVTLTPHHHICVQGAYTNEHFQYLDRPRSKWTYKKTFIQK